MTFIGFFIQLLFIPALAPLFVGAVRKLKARMQNRHGASVMQPYWDIWKLIQKDEVVSDDASWVSFVGPYLIFAVALVVGILVPIFGDAPLLGAPGDIIVLIYLLALATFFMALLGLDAGNAFGGLGGSREMTLAALAEAGLLFSLLPAAVIAGSTQLSAMFFALDDISALENTALLIAFLAFFIALLAENSRYPFDNPSTHLELTMVHEAMIIEASGKRLALLEWASAIKLFAFAVIGANVFFPTFSFFGGGLVFLVVKISLIAIAIAAIESSTPKLRFFRLPDLLFTSFVLGVIALGIAVI